MGRHRLEAIPPSRLGRCLVPALLAPALLASAVSAAVLPTTASALEHSVPSADQHDLTGRFNRSVEPIGSSAPDANRTAGETHPPESPEGSLAVAAPQELSTDTITRTASTQDARGDATQNTRQQRIDSPATVSAEHSGRLVRLLFDTPVLGNPEPDDFQVIVSGRLNPQQLQTVVGLPPYGVGQSTNEFFLDLGSRFAIPAGSNVTVRYRKNADTSKRIQAVHISIIFPVLLELPNSDTSSTEIGLIETQTVGFGVNRDSEAELRALSGYDSYTVSPSLPEGLSFQSFWPRVFGKAAAASDVTYVYQATGIGKQRQMGVLRLYVAADNRPMTGFSSFSALSLRTTTFSEVNHLLPSVRGGNDPKYSLVPRLPAGLSFNAETRRITGSTSERFPSQLFSYIAVDANGNRRRESFLLEVKNRPLTLQSRTHNVVSTPFNIISTPFTISLDRASGLGFVNYNLCAGDEAVCPALPGNWSF